MKITNETTFAQLESAQRQPHEAAVLRAQAQTEAARELLTAATERGHERLDFWREALEHAEAEEARSRRAFTNWQRRDQERRPPCVRFFARPFKPNRRTRRADGTGRKPPRPMPRSRPRRDTINSTLYPQHPFSRGYFATYGEEL